MKYIYSLFFITLFVSANVFSQERMTKDELTEEWQLIQEQEDIKVYVQSKECSFDYLAKPLSYVFVMVENNSTNAMKVQYNIALHFEEGCSGCEEESEYNTGIIIKANSSIEGTCDTKKKEVTRLILNPNLKGGWKFESVSIMHLKITPEK